MKFTLEICIDSIESAIVAQEAGAERVELCGGLPEGGTTPSPGTIATVRKNLDIALNVIIRPRGSDFLYSDPEYDIMRRDIEYCGEAGVNGIVIGILLRDGNIDIERTGRLVEFAKPMSVTFHRAFDMCPDPIKGVKDIIITGADRILTSGQKDNCSDGAHIISQLIKNADDRIIIMPGGGLNENNIGNIAKITHAKEYHMTARSVIESEMIFRKTGISMGGSADIPEYSRKVADIEKIRKVIEILKMI